VGFNFQVASACANGSTCVGIGRDGDIGAVRDQWGDVLIFTSQELDGFIKAAKEGQLDLI